MRKPLLLFRGPVKSVSGYGAHSRDLLKALYELNLYDIKVDSCVWGHTPLTALSSDNVFHKWIESNIVQFLDTKPDIYVQVTVPNEFMTLGRFNIGVTAGIETTAAPRDWIDGCNKMDFIITTSEFSKMVLSNTLYNEIDKVTNQVIKQHKIQTPIEVLFEGADTNIYKKIEKLSDSKLKNQLDKIECDFCFLFVGHWLKGRIGHDRKDVGSLIKYFSETFSNSNKKIGLILKTSSATFSIKDREMFRKKITEITKEYKNPPPIYLLFGDLTDQEMNDLYNHSKVKAMVSMTKGEGFGRPLLEFSLVGKPIIVSNWSGHKDFLPSEKSILIGGTINEVDESSIDKYIIKDSKWFTVNYEEFSNAMIMVSNNYDNFLKKSESLRIDNQLNFSFSKMKDKMSQIITKYNPTPTYLDLILPELIKID